VVWGRRRTRGGAHTNKQEHTHKRTAHTRDPAQQPGTKPASTPRTHRHSRAHEQQAERAPPPPRRPGVIAWQGDSRAPGCNHLDHLSDTWAMDLHLDLDLDWTFQIKSKKRRERSKFARFGVTCQMKSKKRREV
jgi:hypothetical protein